MMRTLAREAEKRGLWTAAHIGLLADLRTIVECGISISAHTPGDAEMDGELITSMVEKGVPMMTTVGDMTGMHPMNIPEVYGTLEGFNVHRNIMLRNLKKFYDAGGMILIGTDLAKSDDFDADAVIPYFEIAQLQSTGIPLHAAIAAGTVNPAKVFGLDDYGLIAPGMSANIIAFREKLDDSFKALDHPPFVMNRGRILTNRFG